MVKVEQAAHQSKIIKRRGQASRIPQEREKKRKLFLVALQLLLSQQTSPESHGLWSGQGLPKPCSKGLKRDLHEPEKEIGH